MLRTMKEYRLIWMSRIQVRPARRYKCNIIIFVNGRLPEDVDVSRLINAVQLFAGVIVRLLGLRGRGCNKQHRLDISTTENTKLPGRRLRKIFPEVRQPSVGVPPETCRRAVQKTQTANLPQLAASVFCRLLFVAGRTLSKVSGGTEENDPFVCLAKTTAGIDSFCS
ncbi:hypothetical protein BaRGS_00009642 [Batillaria attramentaria]|uniref:Uncharacterized protein n=1 Tax=Batillaria attramentaria TaxID=370345 RepID=A0ABD0LIB1_9CAEN